MKTIIIILLALVIYGCCKEAVKDIPNDTEIVKRNIERQKQNEKIIDSLKIEVKK